MRIAWSRIPRAPLLLFLIALGAPAIFIATVRHANAIALSVLAALVTVTVWHIERDVPREMTLDQWRARMGNRDSTQGCTSISIFLAGMWPAWIVGWEIAARMDFSVSFLRGLTAVTLAILYYVVLLLCLAFILDTRPPPVPEHLRAEAATRPQVTGVDGAVDPREIAPGFVADVNPTGTATLPPPPAPAPLRRVLRVPQVAAWKPASERRLRFGDWRSVLGVRFVLGLGVVAGLIAGAVLLGAWRGGALAILAALAVIAAAGARAARWEWPGEVSLADWFRSERSLVNAQKGLGNLSSALVVGSGLVIAGESVLRASSGRADLYCGMPLVMIAAAIAMPLAWRFTLRRSIAQPPAVRAVPEPIRQAVLAVARRREEVVSRTRESEEISVVEDLGGVAVAPASAEAEPPPAMPAAPQPEGALARESAERLIAELTRAASLKPDGAQLVRRVEIRLGHSQQANQPGDTDLLVDVAELLFLAFPDRAAALVSALGDALANPTPAKP